MLKKFGVALSFLLAALGARAQFTTVTGNAVDSDSIAWVGGTISIQFVPNPSQSNIGVYRINGAPLDPTVITQGPYTLGAGGAMPSESVYDNMQITPTGSSWQFTVCPKATSKCGVFTTAVTGASYSLTAQIGAAIPAPRFNAIAGTYGYADVEAILSLPVGATYWNVANLCQRINNGSAWSCLSNASGCTVGGTSNQIVTNNGSTGCNSSPATADSQGNVGNVATLTAHNGEISNISGLHFVDGITAWSNTYGTGSTIAIAYADACINGGTLEIAQYYTRSDTIPSSCSSLSIGSPVQSYVRVVDDRVGQQANIGTLNVQQFGVDGTGTSDTTTALTSALAAASTGPTYISNLGNPAPLFFPSGAYQVHEFNATNGSPQFYGATTSGATRVYYGGAGGSGSYLFGVPLFAYGGIQNMLFSGVNVGFHSAVTTMAQTGILLNQGSTLEIDAGAKFNGLSIQNVYGNGFQFGTPSKSGSLVNAFFSNFRTDVVGGYAFAMYNANVANGNPVDFSDFTTVNQMSGLVQTYCISAGYCNNNGSGAVSTYGSGTLFVSEGRGQTYRLQSARLEEDSRLNTVGNRDEGQIFSNDDTNGIGAAFMLQNIDVAENTAGPHPIFSSAQGGVQISLYGTNSASVASGILKNRLTQQEYGDQYKFNSAFWTYGRLPAQFQGGCMENWCLDVIPVSSRASNVVPRLNSDWFIRRQADFVAGASGPLDVVVSPVTGRASLEVKQVLFSNGTLSSNSSFLTSGLSTITAASGGSLTGVGNCTLTGFNNGLTGAIAVVTLTSAGSWSGATFTVLVQGNGATTATGLTGTLSSGNPVDSMNHTYGPVGIAASCSGTATLTATITSPASGSPSYASITGFDPLYPSSHIALHLGDNLVLPNTGPSGSGSTNVTVACVDGIGTFCQGIGATGIVVTPAPACLTTGPCPTGGTVEGDFLQATLSNFGLEANRTSSTTLDGTSCPYKGDYIWYNSPAKGSPLGYGCGADLLWHVLGSYPYAKDSGVLALVSGTRTIATTAACTPSSTCSYTLTRCADNASTAAGVPTVGSVNPGTSFVVNSYDSTHTLLTGDLATICWRIN